MFGFRGLLVLSLTTGWGEVFSWRGVKRVQTLTSHFNSWDDWVPQDRLRKFTEENRELASTLRRDAEAAFRHRTGQKPLSRKRGGSDSGRGSEERQSSVPARGNKRGRDNEIEKVRVHDLVAAEIGSQGPS